MKDILFHLPNEGLEGVGSFILGFSYAHINTAFCFYMYDSLQVVSCVVTLLWYGRHKIDSNHENIVPSGS